jgi:hypothetical protein
MSFFKEFRQEFHTAYGSTFTLALFECFGVMARWATQGFMMALGAYVALSYVGFIK